MKTKIAMLISTAGVLVAGSAAALVNTHVLGSSTTTQPSVFAAAPATQPATTTVTLAPAVATQPTTATTVVSTPTPTAVATGSQAVYAIGDAGTVTLDTAGDVLTIVGVTPSGGWTVTKSENEDPTNVEIKFQSATLEVEFHANLLFGVVTTSVESHDQSVTGSSVDDSGGSGHSGDDGSDDDSGHGGDDGSDDDSGHGGGDDD